MSKEIPDGAKLGADKFIDNSILSELEKSGFIEQIYSEPAKSKESKMLAKIKHLAIISDNYVLLSRFYEALFGMETGKSPRPESARRHRRQVYVEGEWKQDRYISHFMLRSLNPANLARFCREVYELQETENPPNGPNHYLTDRRVTIVIAPWAITEYDGGGIEPRHRVSEWKMSNGLPLHSLAAK